MPNHQSSPPRPSAWEISRQDRQPSPALLQPSPVTDYGRDRYSSDVYISAAKHREEVEKVWKRCWQMACREEQLSGPGAVIVYDVAELSALVLRDAGGQLRAFTNSCPHRGTRLCNTDDTRQQLRCPFHGMTWTLEGTLKQLTCAWDFSEANASALHLRSLPVATWGGFVFISFDPAIEPLEDYLEILPEHFKRWPLERRFTAAHVAKVMDCNWKIALEAFIETFHVIGLHPQSLPFLGDTNSQYDVWPGVRHVSRMINPSGVSSPHVEGHYSPQRMLDAAAEFGLCAPGTLRENETPRQRIIDHLRALMTERGIELDGYSDSEVVDVIEYNLFPNLVVFGGFSSPLAYRIRPHGNDHERCLFEVYLLLPCPTHGEPPAPAPTRWLREDENFASVEALSYFGPILDQDAVAMPQVQRGLAASTEGSIHLSRYQEIRIRHLRETLEQYLSAMP